jgi:dTDP-4-amino-4,6-dideoxygalactose transaminase
MSTGEYIVFGKPRFHPDEIQAVSKAFEVGWVGTGPRVKDFQLAFGDYIGAQHSVAVGSCTAALHITMEAAGIRQGDEVITTPLTFAATANSIIHAGAVPVFADVDPKTMNLDPLAVEEKISAKTRAILVVHLAGRPCEMDPFVVLAKRYGLLLFEDAAHAIESWYHGRKIGTLGDAACFSFYVTKNITTIEGGMICTAREDIANKARILAMHGMSADAWSRFSDQGYRHYEVIYTGYKFNMTDVQASVGLRQLSRVKESLVRRNAIWDRYTQAFADLPCTLPAAVAPNTVHARHLYTLLVDEKKCGVTRDDFMKKMHEQQIGTGVHYRALHNQPYYRKQFGYRPMDFPNAFTLGEQTVSIPLSQHLTDDEADRVIVAVRKILRREI